MAVLVGANERFELDITVAAIDNNGVLQTRTKSFQFSDGITTYLDAAAAAGAFITLLDAINEADIVAYAIRTVADETTGAVTAVGNVFKEAILSLRIDGYANKKVPHTIYSPYDAMVDGNSVVLTPAVHDYLDSFGTGGDFTVSDGETIPTTEALRVASKRVRTIARALRG